MADWVAGFEELTAKTHVEQAIWFLNGFWEEQKENAEDIWKYTQLMIELDMGTTIRFKGKKGLGQGEKKMGCDIDEFKSHQFLERLGETLTVVALRKRLKALDIDNNKRLALSEYLLNKYEKEPLALVQSPQGDNKAELDEAQQKLNEVQTALQELQDALREQQIALAAQKEEAEKAEKALEVSTYAKHEAEAALSLQKSAEEVVKKAEAELQAAVDELKRQEEEYHGKIAALKAKGEDSSLGVVTRNKAKNEVAQLESEDPLPLRRAKITQEAALKRVQKERKKAESATAVAAEKAEKARVAHEEADAAAAKAQAAKVEAEARTAEVEKEVQETEAAFNEAVEYLNKVKQSGGGVAQGAIWWMERELTEARKYMPQNRR